ncbi:MAG: hypothetical protein ACI90V_013659, partial [Bacillariaceae sp.]
HDWKIFFYVGLSVIMSFIPATQIYENQINYQKRDNEAKHMKEQYKQ